MFTQTPREGGVINVLIHFHDRLLCPENMMQLPYIISEELSGQICHGEGHNISRSKVEIMLQCTGSMQELKMFPENMKQLPNIASKLSNVPYNISR